MGKVKVTDEAREKVKALFEEGISPKDIAVTLNLSSTTVRIILNDGATISLQALHQDKSKRLKLLAYQDFIRGMSKEEICTKYDRSRSWVNDAIKDVRQWEDDLLAKGEFDNDLVNLKYAEHKKEYPKLIYRDKIHKTVTHFTDVSADWM